MGNKKKLLLHLVFVIILAFTYGQQCKVVPKCSCKFGDETVDVKEQSTNTEALAGAVGAVSSLIVSGGGFGAWYLLKGRKLTSLARQDSFVSQESDDSRSPISKKRSPASGNVVQPNIYTAGKNDDLNFRVGANAFHRKGIDDI